MDYELDTSDLNALSQERFADDNDSNVILHETLKSISKAGQGGFRRNNDGKRDFEAMLNQRRLLSRVQLEEPRPASEESKKEAVEIILHPIIGDVGQCFATRRISLEVGGKPIMIGRLVNGSISYPAQELSTVTSGVFDCRVMSRQHATLKCLQSGEIFITDLNSSNGTCVNSTKIPANKPVQLHNNDILQFGQEVADTASNSKHKCVVARVELVSNVKDLKDDIDSSAVSELALALGLFEEREKSLGEKLERVKLLLLQVRGQVKKGWKAMVDEDSILSRIDFLENSVNEAKKKNQAEEAKIKIDQSIKEKILTLKDSDPTDEMVEERLIRKLDSRVSKLESRSSMLVDAQKTTFSLMIYLSVLLTLLLTVTYGGFFARRSYVTLSTW